MPPQPGFSFLKELSKLEKRVALFLIQQVLQQQLSFHWQFQLQCCWYGYRTLQRRLYETLHSLMRRRCYGRATKLNSSCIVSSSTCLNPSSVKLGMNSRARNWGFLQKIAINGILLISATDRNQGLKEKRSLAGPSCLLAGLPRRAIWQSYPRD